MLRWLRRLVGGRSAEGQEELTFDSRDCWDISPTEDGAAFVIWPRPDRHHLPASRPVLEELASCLETLPDRRMCYHCHLYCEGALVLVWYDAFADPIYVAGTVDEARVLAFAQAFGATATRRGGKT